MGVSTNARPQHTHEGVRVVVEYRLNCCSTMRRVEDGSHEVRVPIIINGVK